jgi:hypothetical protein
VSRTKRRIAAEIVGLGLLTVAFSAAGFLAGILLWRVIFEIWV